MWKCETMIKTVPCTHNYWLKKKRLVALHGTKTKQTQNKQNNKPYPSKTHTQQQQQQQQQTKQQHNNPHSPNKKDKNKKQQQTNTVGLVDAWVDFPGTTISVYYAWKYIKKIDGLKIWFLAIVNVTPCVRFNLYAFHLNHRELITYARKHYIDIIYSNTLFRQEWFQQNATQKKKIST